VIDFALSEEQVAFRDLSRRFAEQEIASVAAHYDEHDEFPWPVVEKAFRAGLMNISVPEEYGGGGLSVLDGTMVREELSAGCSGITSTLMIGGLAAAPLIIAGTDEQKKTFLGQLCSDYKSAVASYALTEPGAGSDVAGITTTARRVGDEYVINGTKRFISGAVAAAWFVIFAYTDKEQRYNGISAFIVPADTSGLTVGKKEPMMGQHASHTSEVILEEVTIPAANRIGEENQGWQVAMQTFNRTRPGVAASAVGLARSAMQHALRYSQERETFSQPIAYHQAIQFMLADMATTVAAARWLTWHASWMIDQGIPNATEAAYAKAFAADTAMRVTTDAVQIFGGYGYSKEFPVEKLMRDAKIFQIYEGTSQIQRLIIGRSLLKDGIHMPGALKAPLSQL
jgi:acyl-CoA dehydrogenase